MRKDMVQQASLIIGAVLLCIRLYQEYTLVDCRSPYHRSSHKRRCRMYVSQGPKAYWRQSPPPSPKIDSTGKRSLESSSWYGNSTLVGQSPYDFFPRSLRTGEKKTRILFLLDFDDYLKRMNSHSYEIVDAALQHPRVEADVWGLGWAGWDAGTTISQNIEKRIVPGTTHPVGCGYYDFVWSFSNYPSKRSKDVDTLRCDTIHVHQLGDCHSDECIGAIFDQTGNITASKYAFELLDMMPHDRLKEKYPQMDMQLFTHSPDAANPWDYFPLSNWEFKESGAVLFGAIEQRLYKLRSRIGTAMQQNRTFITKYSHPGFYINRKRTGKPPATYEPNHASYAPQIRLRRAFAEGMRNAQICVFDSSILKKAIRKYAQAFLSGCVVAGDLPTEQEAAFRDFMIVLRPEASIDEINEIIYNALMDPLELQRKALAAFAYAREYLTNMRKVDIMISDVEKYKKGVRGYSFAYPFSLNCRQYWKLTVPWCNNGMNEYRPRYPASPPVYKGSGNQTRDIARGNGH